MSPIAPAPKSCHARQPNGWYVFWNGRIGEGPIQRSQSKPSGTASVSVGRGMPCGQIGRLVQQYTSRTWPSAPASSHSCISRRPSSEWPWLPICVTTLYLRAASVNARASLTVRVSGFCT